MNQSVFHLLVATLLIALAFPAGAIDFFVNNTQDVAEETPGNGQCNPVGAVGATCTLRAAVMEANANAGPHNILLPSGNYSLTLTGADEDAAATGDLDILEDITIINGTSDHPLVFGGYADRVFDVQSGAKLTLQNVDVAGGMANQPGTVHGGGIRVAGSAALELVRAVVSGNIGNIGGGIYSDGTVTVSDSEFFNNALVADHVALEFANGAAILNRGVLSITRSTLRDNGRFPGSGDLVLIDGYVVHSRVGFVADPLVVISHSTFHNNTNGIFSDKVNTGIAYSTIVNNNFRGVRFLADPGALGDEQLAIGHSVLFGQTSDCNGLPDNQVEFNVANNSNASSDDTCGFTGATDFENISYPFNGGLADHGGPTATLMPRSDGVLIDPPDSVCVFLTALEDQRGSSRPLDGDDDGDARCDIGAVEFNFGIDPMVPDLMFGDRFEKP